MLPVQNGNRCRSRPENISGQDRRRWTVFGLNGEVQPVEVGLAEAALRDLQQVSRLKFFEIRSDAAVGGAHVLQQA